MMNDYHPYLQLAFDRADAVNSFWNIDIAVALGIIGVMASAKPFTRSARVKIVLTLGFVIFAGSNLLALLQTNMQRVELLKLVMLESRLAPVASVSGPELSWLLIVFHCTIDLLVVLAIWLVPWHAQESR